jgi:hypothetical protein
MQAAFAVLRVTAGYHQRSAYKAFRSALRSLRLFAESNLRRINWSISVSRSSIKRHRMPFCRRRRWRAIRSAPGERGDGGSVRGQEIEPAQLNWSAQHRDHRRGLRLVTPPTGFPSCSIDFRDLDGNLLELMAAG